LESGKREGEKRWTWVSHLSGCEELVHWAIVVETAKAVARYDVRSFVWIMVSCVVFFLSLYCVYVEKSTISML
jgi:hypothetical protein